MEVEPGVLAEPDDESADSLVSSNDPDDMANEQTWPTEEEMVDASAVDEASGSDLPAAEKGTTPKAVRRVPKGMSEYQAAWIIDEDEEDGDEGPRDEDEEMEEEAEEMVDLPDDDVEDSRKSVQFQDLDVEEEDRQ